jgi:hypothetical protein
MAKSRLLLWSRFIGVFLAFGVFVGVLFLQTAPTTRAVEDPTDTPTSTSTSTSTPTNTPTPTATSTTSLSATQPIATVSPTTINFGSVPQGTTSANQTVTLTNTGGANLQLTTPPEFKGGDLNDFSIGPNSCGPAAPMPPQTSCTVVVRFNPAANVTGNRSTTLLFRDNSGTGSPQFVLLNGVATTAPTVTSGGSTVSFNPTILSFGSQPIGVVSGAQFVIVTNTGTNYLNITDVTKSGGNAGDFSNPSTNCITSLAPGAQCQLSMTFTPTTPGNRATTVIITDNAPSSGSTQVILVSGIGTGTPATPTFTPAPTQPPAPTRPPVTPTPTSPPPPPPPTALPSAPPAATATGTTAALPGLPSTGMGTEQPDSATVGSLLAVLIAALLGFVAFLAWRGRTLRR